MPLTKKLEEVKKELLAEVDAYIQQHRLRSLYMFGDFTQSVFLQSVWRRAINYHMNISCWSPAAPVPDGAAAIVDFEHLICSPDSLVLLKSQDIDHSYYPGVSACAEAIAALLGRFTKLRSLHVVIIGRGHAVQGLHSLLLEQDAVVTTLHSKADTKLLQELCSSADIVVNAAPNLPHRLNCRDLLLDVGCVPNYSAYTCYKNIGALTVAYLLKRCIVQSEQDVPVKSVI